MLGLPLRVRFGLLVGWIALAAAGCPDDGGSGDGDGGTDAGATGATDTGTVGATGLDETSGPPEPDMGLMPPSACEAMCAARGACGESEIACVNGCDADYSNFEQEPDPCLSDFEALLGCVAGLSCDDLATFDDPPMDMDYPCMAENEAFTTSCLLGGNPPPATCEAYCTVLSMCTEFTPSECDAICSMQLEFAEGLSKACATATTAMLDCVGMIADCADYDAFDQQTDANPCATEVADVELLCAM